MTNEAAEPTNAHIDAVVEQVAQRLPWTQTVSAASDDPTRVPSDTEKLAGMMVRVASEDLAKAARSILRRRTTDARVRKAIAQIEESIDGLQRAAAALTALHSDQTPQRE